SRELLDPGAFANHDHMLLLVCGPDPLEINFAIAHRGSLLNPRHESLRDIGTRLPVFIEDDRDEPHLRGDRVNAHSVQEKDVSAGKIRRSVGFYAADRHEFARPFLGGEVLEVVDGSSHKWVPDVEEMKGSPALGERIV